MRAALKDLRGFIYYFCFWLVLSLLDRIIFLISYVEKVQDASFSDIFRIFFAGFALDLSMASYICVLPFLAYCILGLLPKTDFKRKALNWYTLIFIIVFFIVSFANVNIYREWGDKISKRALEPLGQDPLGAFSTVGSTPVIVPILGVLLFSAGTYWLYLKLFKKVSFPQQRSKIWFISLFLLGGVILFSFIRGGYGRAPLNPSRAYFSANSFYNHAAVNTHYALLREFFTRNQRQRSPYRYFNDKKAISELMDPIFEHRSEATVNVLTTPRPNVVMIVVESFVGQLIESMGGDKGIAPHFESLIQEGVFFNQIYAASDRSDKGIVGIFSAFPAQGPESIIKYIDKHEKMPGIGQEFKAAGYHTSFYHGGQSEFYNMKSYMLTHGVERVVDNIDFNPLEPRTSWGVYDHIVFNRMIKDLQKEKQPFFTSMFTLVNHEPFELKDNYQFGTSTNVDKFKSTAFYTDQAIYNFIQDAKKQPWYKNTLFVLIADHGHRLPTEKYDIVQPERFHIPLLFFGDVIKPEFRGKKYGNIGNQTDLASTLLNQLGLPNSRYTWSRDLFNATTAPIAFYNSKDAFGVITKDQVVSFDRVGNRINYEKNKEYPTSKTDSLLLTAKAYYQTVYEDFIQY